MRITTNISVSIAGTGHRRSALMLLDVWRRILHMVRRRIHMVRRRILTYGEEEDTYIW